MSLLFHKVMGRGRPIVLIHGFCETHQVWLQVADRFSDHFEVFLPDLPGFGASTLPSHSFSIDHVGESLAKWIEKTIGQPAVLVGHSLGGYVALSVAVRFPKLVAGLGLFHSTASPDTEEKKINRNKTAAFVKENGVAPFVDVFVPGLFHQKTHPSIPEVTTLAKNTSPDTLIGYTYAMRDRPSRYEWLKRFDLKFLMVAGEFDPILPLDVLAGQSTLARHTSFKVLKNTGHMGMYEAPDETTEIIKSFSLTCF